MNKEKQLNFVDLFCGAGGLSRGLEMAGFHCVMGTDNDKAAMTTFERNHPEAEAYLGDISDIPDQKFRKIAKTQKIHLICAICNYTSCFSRSHYHKVNFFFSEKFFYLFIISKI